MKEGLKIPMDVESLVSGINEIEKGAVDVYSVPKSENDINLFNRIYEAFNTYDEDSGKHFKEIIFENNKDIESLNDLAQQVLISFSLISYLLKLKSKNNKVSLLDIISSIKYGSERKDWLFLMIERVVPYMAANKLI